MRVRGGSSPPRCGHPLARSLHTPHVEVLLVDWRGESCDQCACVPRAQEAELCLEKTLLMTSDSALSSYIEDAL